MILGKQKIVAALDIGGSNITTLVASYSTSGEFEIIGKGVTASEGVSSGCIKNIKMARASLAASVYEAEKASSRSIDAVLVNVSDKMLQTKLVKVVVDCAGKQILSTNIQKAIHAALSKIDLSKEEILHHSIISYDVDDLSGIQDPEFMFANKLTAYVNIVTVPVRSLINLSSCLLGCQLKVLSFCSDAFASALVCVNKEEQKQGSIVLDIGSDTMDYISIKDNKIMGIGSLPMGGKLIQRDVSNYFGISDVEAEKIKNIHGKLYDFISDDADIIPLESSNNSALQDGVSNGLVNKVISARLEEMIGVLLEKIKNNNMHKMCMNNFIITGGVSNFIGIEDFLKKKFGLNAKKACPNVNGIIYEPELSTAVGSIHYFLNKENKFLNPQGSNKMFSWIKQYF